MKSIVRQFKSYLFEGENGTFRAIPFYELSIEECIIYQDAKPKYLLDLNRRDQPIVQDIKGNLELLISR